MYAHIHGTHSRMKHVPPLVVSCRAQARRNRVQHSTARCRRCCRRLSFTTRKTALLRHHHTTFARISSAREKHYTHSTEPAQASAIIWANICAHLCASQCNMSTKPKTSASSTLRRRRRWQLRRRRPRLPQPGKRNELKCAPVKKSK